MAQRLTDERLAWLAVRDRLSKKSARGSMLRRLFGSSEDGVRIDRDGKMRDTNGWANEVAGDKMRDYAFAVDQIADQLSVDERRSLRETGQVPAWFLDQVEERRKEIRNRR